MTLRRFFALLVSGTVLHLSVAAGDSTCVEHEDERQHAVDVHAGAPASHAMPGDDHATPTAPCEAPTQQYCCDAVVGCGVDNAAAGARPVLATTASPRASIRAALHDAPASFASAPEPPPPKA